MAKGEGGGGNFDARRRAAKPKVGTGYADSPEVLSALVKPRSKPTVVVKKKKVLAPSRVQTDSNSGEPAEVGTKMTTTRYNVGKPSIGTGYPKPTQPRSADWGRPGFIEAELRSQRPLARQTSNSSAKSDRLANEFSSIGNYSPGPGLYGQGLKLLDWVKRRKARTVMKDLDT
jgi:hypothetical protein